MWQWVAAVFMHRTSHRELHINIWTHQMNGNDARAHTAHDAYMHDLLHLYAIHTMFGIDERGV